MQRCTRGVLGALVNNRTRTKVISSFISFSFFTRAGTQHHLQDLVRLFKNPGPLISSLRRVIPTLEFLNLRFAFLAHHTRRVTLDYLICISSHPHDIKSRHACLFAQIARPQQPLLSSPSPHSRRMSPSCELQGDGGFAELETQPEDIMEQRQVQKHDHIELEGGLV